MLRSLFVKECTQTAKSITYWIMVIILGVFFITQVKSFDFPSKPEPSQESYGRSYSDDKDLIMRFTLGELINEYNRGNFDTYPVGFYKQVKLSEKEEKRVGEIIKETTGLADKEQIEKHLRKQMEELSGETETSKEIVVMGMPQEPVAGLSYKAFEKLMAEVDDILGGGSNYAKDMLMTNAYVPMTYEDALEEYTDLMEKEHFTGGFARLFCDYMGIMLALLPAFLAVTRGLRDRRSRMQELIASRRASSFTIITSRYLSIIVMILVPVILLSLVSLAECIQFASREGITYDSMAFLKYSLGWLLPSIMISAAVGMVFTELTDTAVGILIQVVWWFVSLFMNMTMMQKGAYGWSLIPRHNTWREYSSFQSNFGQLALNRAVYTIAALVLVGISVWIYEMKRRGRLNIHDKIFGNRKRKSKA